MPGGDGSSCASASYDGTVKVRGEGWVGLSERPCGIWRDGWAALGSAPRPAPRPGHAACAPPNPLPSPLLPFAAALRQVTIDPAACLWPQIFDVETGCATTLLDANPGGWDGTNDNDAPGDWVGLFQGCIALCWRSHWGWWCCLAAQRRLTSCAVLSSAHYLKPPLTCAFPCRSHSWEWMCCLQVGCGRSCGVGGHKDTHMGPPAAAACCTAAVCSYAG